MVVVVVVISNNNCFVTMFGSVVCSFLVGIIRSTYVRAERIVQYTYSWPGYCGHPIRKMKAERRIFCHS